MPLGVVRGAYGVKGWVRVEPYDRDAVVLQSVRPWWLQREARNIELEITQVRRHGNLLVAKWVGCENPEAADEMRGALISVARRDFPPPAPGEHYWVDLIGASVVNRAGVQLGRVVALQSNGVQDLLEIEGPHGRFLVPLVEQYVDAIEADSIRVDWEMDW